MKSYALLRTCANSYSQGAVLGKLYTVQGIV